MEQAAAWAFIQTTKSLRREKASHGDVHNVGGAALRPSIVWRRMSDMRAINFGGGGAEASVGTARGMPDDTKSKHYSHDHNGVVEIQGKRA